MLGLIELDLELADLLRAGLAGGKERGRVLTLPLGARDFVAGGVLLALEPLDLGNQPPPPRFERRQLLEIGVDIEAAVAKRGADLLEVIAHECGVYHALDPNGSAPRHARGALSPAEGRSALSLSPSD